MASQSELLRQNHCKFLYVMEDAQNSVVTIVIYRVFLAEQFDSLRKHIEQMIPQSKRAFLHQFYSQVSIFVLFILVCQLKPCLPANHRSIFRYKVNSLRLSLFLTAQMAYW